MNRCCSAAWIKKSSDTKIGGLSDNWRIIASAVASTVTFYCALETRILVKVFSFSFSCSLLCLPFL